MATVSVLLCSGCSEMGMAGGLKKSSLSETELKNPPEGYYKTDVWKAVPMSDQKESDSWLGGEGTQWPLCLEMDSSEGKLAFLGTDVGGIYRSTDGGVTWTPCTIGFYACGATGISIDPNNISRVLAVGANSVANGINGIYLSEDAGDSWDNTYPAKVGSYRDYRRQIAWDKSSMDKKINGSSTAYWSREARDDNNTGAEIHPALYKTTDGGKTWEELSGTSEYAGCDIAVNPETGVLYVAGKNGMFSSDDGGKSFNKILDGNILSMDTVYTYPDFIFVTKTDGMYYSQDAGKTFSVVTGSGYPTHNPSHLRVSPVNINYMMLQDDHMATQGDKSSIYYTNDGGATWSRSSRGNEEDYRKISGSWIPYNARQCVFAWSPVDKQNVLTLGGDFVMRSNDGGKSFVWSNSGYTGMMTGGKFNFNANHSDWVFNPSQDYNGGYSLDGGETWKYIQWYQDWGGYTYGGYVIDENTIVCGGDDRVTGLEIWITFDGGKTVVKTGRKIKGEQVANGVPGDDNVVFIGEWRSDDKGKTWKEMTDCKGVFTYDSETGVLYGSNGVYAVKSSDKGITWERVGTVGNIISDMTWEAKTKSLLIASGGKVFRIGTDTGKIRQIVTVPADQYGAVNVVSVAADTKNSDIIYLASRNGTYQTENSVMRSVDGGKTWVVLTRRKGDGLSGPDGAKEASCIRINPAAGKVFVATCCRGMWSMKVPQV